jgi:hypothetical protein
MLAEPAFHIFGLPITWEMLFFAGALLALAYVMYLLRRLK